MQTIHVLELAEVLKIIIIDFLNKNFKNLDNDGQKDREFQQINRTYTMNQMLSWNLKNTIFGRKNGRGDGKEGRQGFLIGGVTRISKSSPQKQL